MKTKKQLEALIEDLETRLDFYYYRKIPEIGTRFRGTMYFYIELHNSNRLHKHEDIFGDEFKTQRRHFRHRANLKLNCLKQKLKLGHFKEDFSLI